MPEVSKLCTQWTLRDMCRTSFKAVAEVVNGPLWLIWNMDILQSGPPHFSDYSVDSLTLCLPTNIHM